MLFQLKSYCIILSRNQISSYDNICPKVSPLWETWLQAFTLYLRQLKNVTDHVQPSLRLPGLGHTFQIPYELQKHQPNFGHNNFDNNLLYSSPIIFLQTYSQTTLTTKIIKKKKKTNKNQTDSGPMDKTARCKITIISQVSSSPITPAN